MVVYVLSCFVIFIVPMLLVFSKQYTDGMFGRFGLSIMSISAFTILYEMAHGWRYEPYPQNVGLLFGMSVFLIWILARVLVRRRKRMTA